MSVKKDFRTCDLYFAAFLKAAGIVFTGSSKVGRKTYFIFENDDEMRGMRDGYFAGTAQVSALRHANEIRNLKRLCHMP
jgi:hypothetical protein